MLNYSKYRRFETINFKTKEDFTAYAKKEASISREILETQLFDFKLFFA